MKNTLSSILIDFIYVVFAESRLGRLKEKIRSLKRGSVWFADGKKSFFEIRLNFSFFVSV